MSALPINSERRRKRSTQTITALTLQLEHIFEREELRNFTLGDSRGLVIAQAGEMAESDILAAYAPLLCRSTEKGHRERILARMPQFVPGIEADAIHVKSFDVDGEPLFLTIVGQPGVYRHVGMYRAVTGVRRILGQFPND